MPREDNQGQGGRKHHIGSTSCGHEFETTVKMRSDVLVYSLGLFLRQRGDVILAPDVHNFCFFRIQKRVSVRFGSLRDNVHSGILIFWTPVGDPSTSSSSYPSAWVIVSVIPTPLSGCVASWHHMMNSRARMKKREEVKSLCRTPLTMLKLIVTSDLLVVRSLRLSESCNCFFVYDTVHGPPLRRFWSRCACPFQSQVHKFVRYWILSQKWCKKKCERYCLGIAEKPTPMHHRFCIILPSNWSFTTNYTTHVSFNSHPCVMYVLITYSPQTVVEEETSDNDDVTSLVLCWRQRYGQNRWCRRGSNTNNECAWLTRRTEQLSKMSIYLNVNPDSTLRDFYNTHPTLMIDQLVTTTCTASGISANMFRKWRKQFIFTGKFERCESGLTQFDWLLVKYGTDSLNQNAKRSVGWRDERLD